MSKINTEKTYLGIEFGSTRIKAVLIDDGFSVLASGAYGWGHTPLTISSRACRVLTPSLPPT